MSYHQKKGRIKAIRSHQSEHCTFVFTSSEKELGALIHPGSAGNHDFDDSNAFIMVDYIGQEAKDFFTGPYLWLAGVLVSIQNRQYWPMDLYCTLREIRET